MIPTIATTIPCGCEIDPKWLLYLLYLLICGIVGVLLAAITDTARSTRPVPPSSDPPNTLDSKVFEDGERKE